MSLRLYFQLVAVAVCVFAGAAGGAPPARAQTSATLDAGGTHTDYEGPGSTGAFTLSPAFRFDRLSLSVDAVGTFSRFANDWSGQVGLTTSYFTQATGPLQAELDVSVNSSMQPETQGTGTAGGGLRLHLLRENRGLWLGAQGGRATDGTAWHSTVAGDVGGWIRFGGATAVLQLAPSGVGDDLRYLDASTVMRVERGRLELTTTLGVRAWQKPADVATTAWGTINGAFWLGDHLALAASGGSYPADWAQGFTAGNYISIGVRVASHRPTSRQAIAGATQRTLPPLAKPVAEEFQVKRVSNNEWTLEVAAPTADRVEVMGDFTDWRAIPFRRRADGRWAITLPIEPGNHHMNLRVSAGAWGIPPGLPIVTDEFNGVVALLTLE